MSSSPTTPRTLDAATPDSPTLRALAELIELVDEAVDAAHFSGAEHTERAERGSDAATADLKAAVLALYAELDGNAATIAALQGELTRVATIADEHIAGLRAALREAEAEIARWETAFPPEAV